MGKKVGAAEKEYQGLLGAAIRQLRELQDPWMSAATLAERINRSEAALSRWETGKSTPSAFDLREIARVLDLADDQLDLLIRPPDGPVSPVAERLYEAVEGGARTGLGRRAEPGATRGAA